MDSNLINRYMKKYSIYFAVIYLVTFLASSIFIQGFDYIHGLIIGAKIVEGWSLGFMVWFGLIFVIPIIYCLVISFLLYKKYSQ